MTTACPSMGVTASGSRGSEHVVREYRGAAVLFLQPSPFPASVVYTPLPMKVLRLVVSVFFEVFYVSSLNTFLIAVNCSIGGASGVRRGFNESFSTVECMTMPHVFVLIMSVCLMVVFSAVTYLIQARRKAPLRCRKCNVSPHPLPLCASTERSLNSAPSSPSRRRLARRTRSARS